MQKHQIDHVFTYHPPRFQDLARYDAIREAGKYFAHVVASNTPPGPDQSAAIRKVREAVMTANAAIACQGDQALPETGTGSPLRTVLTDSPNAKRPEDSSRL